MPTEYDDVHTEENKPNLDILEPRNNAHFSSPNLNTDIRIQTKRTMDRVEYYIDNQLISTQTRYPYTLRDYKLLGFSNGHRSLRVKAYDDVGNFREKSISIYLNLPEQYTKPVGDLIVESTKGTSFGGETGLTIAKAKQKHKRKS